MVTHNLFTLVLGSLKFFAESAVFDTLNMEHTFCDLYNYSDFKNTFFPFFFFFFGGGGYTQKTRKEETEQRKKMAIINTNFRK